MFTYAVIGFGARGRRYSSLLKERGAKLVAVCDCDPAVFAVAKRDYGLDEGALFTDYNSFFAGGKRADLLIVATTDREHTYPAVEGMKLGYDILLEKPIATSREECDLIERTSEETGRKVVVCHVLRYSPFFRKIKELIESGKYGKVVTINHTENVGYWHFAHSFVRGNWRNEEESTFMLLAKCCHDLDLLVWLTGSSCEAVSSMGSLSWFTHDNPEKGADFCFECKRTDCAYRAEDFYLKRPLWVKVPVLPEENREEFIRNWLRDKSNPYARCVYACDNDVVDHQIVNMRFAGGVTAHLTLSAFTGDFLPQYQGLSRKGSHRRGYAGEKTARARLRQRGGDRRSDGRLFRRPRRRGTAGLSTTCARSWRGARRSATLRCRPPCRAIKSPLRRKRAAKRAANCGRSDGSERFCPTLFFK